MAKYKRLSLADNGGISVPNLRPEPQNSATILIGLGGTGIDCLKTIKRELYRRVKTNSMDCYDHIKFLAVDSDTHSIGNEDEDLGAISKEKGEFVHLFYPFFLGQPPKFQWVNEFALRRFDGNGAHGVRQSGRYLFMLHADKFREKVTQLIQHAITELAPGYSVDIHIFSGTGGGTGSGCFLDACYIIRDLLEKYFQTVNANVLGYFFLPDVNLSCPWLYQSTKQYIQSNSFAVMKELDYCMDLTRRGGKWNQQYIDFKVTTNKAPVDICHLISATTTTGVVVPNGYDYAMNVVSEYVISHISGMLNPQNFAPLHLPRHQHGANYSYCILGASRAIMPRTEIATYLTSKLFAAMEQKSENVPTQAQIKTFLKNCSLDLPQLKQKLSAGAPGIIKIELGSKPYKNPAYKVEPGTADTVEGMLPESITSPYTNKLSTYTSKLDENMPLLTLGWNPNLPDDKKERSLVCRVMESLILCIQNPEQGPTYALKMLEGILASLDQIEIKLTGTESRANVQNVTRAKNEYLGAGFIRVVRKYDDLIDAVHTYYEDKSKDALDAALIKMVRELIIQFSELKTEYIKRYKTMMDDLFDTFKTNLEHLSSKNKVTIVDPFTEMIVTLKALRPSLDQEVYQKDINWILYDFHTKFFGAYDQWQSGSDKDICEFVSNYFYQVFSTYINSSMLQHLVNLFGNDNLHTSVFNNIIQPLSQKASPLFATRGQITFAGTMDYCLIPNVAPIQAAAGMLIAAGSPAQVFSDSNSDQILFVSCRVGVPLFAYSELETCRRLYRAQYQPGTHIYEGEGVLNGNATDPRDWRTLPDIIPFSLIDNPDAELQRKSKIYDEAVQMGMIKSDPFIVRYPQCYVCETAELPTEIAHIERLLETNTTVEVLERAIEFVTQLIQSDRDSGERAFILDDGDPGYPEIQARVRKDNALVSEQVMHILKQEVEKRHRLYALLDRLNQKIQTLA